MVSDGGIQNFDADRFTYTANEWFYSELNLIGHNYGDGQDDTIEVFAVPNGSLQDMPPDVSYGLASPDRNGDRVPGAQNALFVTGPALDGIDEHDPSNGKLGYPFVFGHEVGHILFNGPFPGDNFNDPGHVNPFTNPENLMRGGGTSVREEVTGSKRLTVAQHLDARKDSGPDTTPPILKRE